MLTSSANFATALRHRHFRNLWLGQIVANIGNYFYFLALLISVNELTGSTLAMSLMTISFALPQLVFGMAAGVYVDRWDRRRVMILSDVLRGALVLLCLFVHDPQQVWIYYVVGFAHGVLGSFFNPARDAVIPNLVEPDELLARLRSLEPVELGIPAATLLQECRAARDSRPWPSSAPFMW